MERVELRLAAQYQCVLDVRESLQNLEKDIYVSEKTLTLQSGPKGPKRDQNGQFKSF